MIHQKDFATASLIVKLGNAVTYYRNVKMEDIGLTSVQNGISTEGTAESVAVNGGGDH